MADIVRKFVLEDGFSAVFDKFIDSMENADDAVTRQEEKCEKAVSKVVKVLGSGMKKIGKFVGGTISAAASAFTSFKHIIEKGMDQVPDDIVKPFKKIGEFFEKTLGRAVTSFFKGAKSGMEKLEQALNSPAVQKAIIFLQVGFEAIGAAVGFVAEKIGEFMQFLGEQLGKAGDEFADIFEFVGGLFGALYVTAHNVVAAMWNTIAGFAEFFANAFKDPSTIVIRLFVAVGNAVLNVVQTITRAIDKIFNKNWTSEIQGLQGKLNDWAATQYQNQVTFDRMETITYDDVNKFAAAGRSFGERLRSTNIANEQLATLKNIDEGVGMIADAVTDEDLKMLIDMATQKFVSNVNLTAQTPIITINGANTGNSEADRRTLANTIRDILVEQIASGSTSGQYAYMGA